jgi:valyl-tRNA synthetase
LAYIKTLAKVSDISIGSGIPKPEGSVTAVFGQNQVHVLLEGLMDFGEEKKRLGKEIKKTMNDLEASNKKLSNKDFLEKAPVAIVDEVRAKLEALTLRLEKLQKNLSFFDGFNT